MYTIFWSKLFENKSLGFIFGRNHLITINKKNINYTYRALKFNSH